MPWWLPSRHGSHCSHLSFPPESQISQAVVISTLTFLSLEMWPWDIHSCPWKSDSPECVLLILTEGFHCFSYLGSPLEGASLEHWLGSSGLLNHPWSLKTTYHFLLGFFFFFFKSKCTLKTLKTQELYPFFCLECQKLIINNKIPLQYYQGIHFHLREPPESRMFADSSQVWLELPLLLPVVGKCFLSKWVEW